MTETEAREILADLVQGEENLDSMRADEWGPFQYVCWPSCGDRDEICLDGHFTVEEIQAIAWWIQHKAPQNQPSGISG